MLVPKKITVRCPYIVFILYFLIVVSFGDRTNSPFVSSLVRGSGKDQSYQGFPLVILLVTFSDFACDLFVSLFRDTK